MKNASGRATLILLAGLLGCFAAPSLAGTSDTAASASSENAGKPVELQRYVKHRRHYARRHVSRTAQKSSEDKADKADKSDKADNSASSGAKKAVSAITATTDVSAFSPMPATVANANAQIAAADTPAPAADTVTAGPGENTPAASDAPQAQQAAPVQQAQSGMQDQQTAAPDQLNDVDRALHEDSQPAPQPAVAAAVEAQPRPQPVMAAATDSSSLDRTSLIGKIFIGFGALLTLASAARMLMA